MASEADVELLPCPNPWCEAVERDGDFTPQIGRGFLSDTVQVKCPSCFLRGPTRQTEAEAIAAWNRLRAEQSIRADERAKIVVWLRKEAREDYGAIADQHLWWWTADAIERGDHDNQ